MIDRNSEAQQCANTNRASIENNRVGNIDMNSIANCEFKFQGVALNPVERAGDLWFSSADLAKALGYKKTDAVTQIYSRYSDEFGANMSTTLRERVVRKTGSVEMLVRFFSLRGAHLVAMFASTAKAKEFRRWVLDILDREVAHSPIAKQFTDDELMKMANVWLWAERAREMSKIIYPALRDMESRWAGNFYDLSHETRYPLEEARKILARETAHIKFSGPRAERREALLGMIKKELH